MSCSNPDALARFLGTYGVRNLGDGDPVAGSNKLVAMLAVLAKAAPPGSGLKLSGGDVLRVGVNMVVSGSFSSQLVTDDVLSRLRERQDNVAAHICHEQRRRDEWTAKKAASQTGLGDVPWDKPQSGKAEGAMLDACKDPFTEASSSEDAMRDVVTRRAPRSFADLARQPSVLVTATRAAGLSKQLNLANQKDALAYVGIQRTGDVAEFGEVCGALMDGRASDGTSDEVIRGHVLVTDPCRMIQETAGKDAGSVAWLDRCLLLADGELGVELPEQAQIAETDRLDQLTARYTSALTELLTRRFDLYGGEPVPIDTKGFRQRQHRWIAFLQSCESECPGITGTARNLVATLYFGLILMSAYVPRARRVKVCLEDVEAFARYVVTRMIAIRATVRCAVREERRERKMAGICRQLGLRPRSKRELYRNLSMPADECEDLVSELQRQGIVAREGELWHMASNPRHQVGTV